MVGSTGNIAVFDQGLQGLLMSCGGARVFRQAEQDERKNAFLLQFGGQLVKGGMGCVVLSDVSMSISDIHLDSCVYCGIITKERQKQLKLKLKKDFSILKSKSSAILKLIFD